MTMLALGLMVVGLLLLLLGGEALVRGASALAAAWGLSPLTIGLTVVAFGTSAPEAAVSLGSALTGREDIALGNVVGSNIFNVLLILGLSALVTPLVVSRQVIRQEMPILVAVSLLMLVFALDGQVGRIEGSVLAAGLLAYTGFAVYQGRKEGNNTAAGTAGPAQAAGAPAGAPAPRPRVALQLLYILGGLALLVLGARWFVEGAEAIARALGVSELIIALTVVAAGTSLPEVATSVVASLRGERDIAVGNVIGSNVFNLLGVLGLTAAVAPGGVGVSPEALSFDIPVMVAVAVTCLPVFLTGQIISRWEGIFFLAYYGGYLVYLVLRATNPAAQELFTNLLLWVMLPGTAVLIAFSLWQHTRERRLGRR
jgi:cation:H+ antiporter